MIDVPILAIGFFLNMIAVLFVICCIALILIILVQKGKGGGLSSAFGGGMSGGVLGTKTGDFLTWFTIILVGVMLLFAIILAKFYRPDVPESGAGAATTTTQQAPAAQPSGTTPGTGVSGQNNNGSGETGSALPMVDTSDMMGETGTTDNSANTEDNTNETGDSNLPGN